MLDQIWMDHSLYSAYPNCIKLPPLANSDHNIILLPSCASLNTSYRSVWIFDYRASFIRDFIVSANNINWTPLYYMNNVNDKCETFYNLIAPAISKIPKTKILMSSKDKPWISPLCKHLINLRWSAYRQRNFVLYNFYKSKVKSEILKSKSAVFKNLSKDSRGFWKLINESRKQRKSLNSNFDANEINESLCKVFLPKSTYNALTIDNRSPSRTMVLSNIC